MVVALSERAYTLLKRAFKQRTVAPLRGEAGLKVSEQPPSLEDVFIHLQEQAQ